MVGAIPLLIGIALMGPRVSACDEEVGSSAL